MPVHTLSKTLGKTQYGALFKAMTICQPQKIGPPVVRKFYKVEDIAGETVGWRNAETVRVMYLPRAFAGLLNIGSLQITGGRPLNGRLAWPSLYPSHEIAVNHMVGRYFTPAAAAAGMASTAFEMRAGTGKTFVAAGIISKLNQRTLYIVPKKPLVVQAAGDFTRAFAMAIPKLHNDANRHNDINGTDDINDRAIGKTEITLDEIGLFDDEPTIVHDGIVHQEPCREPIIAQWNSTKRHMDTIAATADIVIMVINSAIKRPPEFFAGFGLVIFDEVHEYCTKTRPQIFWKTAAVPYLLGMTATPNKPFAEIFRFHLGAVCGAESIPDFEYPPNDFRGVVRLIEWYGPDSHSQNLTHEKTKKIFTQYMHEQAIDDAARLRLAVSELTALYDWRGPEGQKHHIYVFAEQISILRQLRAAFHAGLTAIERGDIIDAMDAPELAATAADNANQNETPLTARNEDGLAPAAATELPLFIGGLNQNALASVAEHGRILFTTYGYGGTGISYTKMTAMMFLTSRRANMIQIVGRILRSGSDVSIPRVVVDIIDKRTVMQWQLSDRLPAYNLYGFNLQRIKAEHDRPLPAGWSDTAVVQQQQQRQPIVGFESLP